MSETYLNFPLQLTAEGAFATADDEAHIRQRMEQILFTSPGERVMVPQFGCGVRDLVFAGSNEMLAAAAEFKVAEALQRHMGNQVMINAVEVVPEQEKVYIHILYTRTRDLQQQKLAFEFHPFEAVTRG